MKHTLGRHGSFPGSPSRTASAQTARWRTGHPDRPGGYHRVPAGPTRHMKAAYCFRLVTRAAHSGWLQVTVPCHWDYRTRPTSKPGRGCKQAFVPGFVARLCQLYTYAKFKQSDEMNRRQASRSMDEQPVPLRSEFGNIHRAVLQLFLRYKYMSEPDAIELVKVRC